MLLGSVLHASLLGLSPGIVRAAEEPGPQRPDPALGQTVFATPFAAADSDNGVGVGAVLALYFNDGATAPFKVGLESQLQWTTKGVSDDFLHLEWVHPADTSLRLGIEARYRREPNASWFGSGNLSRRETGHSQRYYEYMQRSPGLRLITQLPVSAHWSVFGTYLYEQSLERTYPGSFLAEQPQIGMSGGRNTPVAFGVLYDSRDSEAWPTRGQFAELSARAAGAWSGSRYSWEGATAGWRGFASLPGHVVIGGRAVADVMVGGVPFYDLDATGSLHELDAAGGAFTLRGFVKDRFVGKGKLIANLELRRLFFDTDLFDQSIDCGAVVFADAGRVFADSLRDGPLFKLHEDGGAGVRAVINHELVLRLDVGVSVEGTRFFMEFENVF